MSAVFEAAEPADRPRIEAFLTARAPVAMFPLSNLANYGMDGGHDFAVRFWIRRAGSEIAGLVAMTEHGAVMPVLPEADDAADYAAAAAALAGRQAISVIGPTAQVRGMQRACGLAAVPANLDHDEPHFLLDLDRLVLPDGPGAIVPLAEAPEATILGWMEDYQRSALGTPPDRAAAEAQKSYRAYIARESHVALMEGGRPLAMTGFNARLPGIVQIGGVYTPPALRGRGHARRALALHLAEARGRGVAQATLFSGSPSATAAYRALGFRQIGEWTLLLFDGRHEVRP